jgi:hypothetical protein
MNASVLFFTVVLAAVGMAPPPPAPGPLTDPNPMPDGPVVVLDTTLGTIKIGLFKTKSPISTENFLRYVREGFYSGTIFHRTICSSSPT